MYSRTISRYLKNWHSCTSLVIVTLFMAFDLWALMALMSGRGSTTDVFTVLKSWRVGFLNKALHSSAHFALFGFLGLLAPTKQTFLKLQMHSFVQLVASGAGWAALASCFCFRLPYSQWKLPENWNASWSSWFKIIMTTPSQVMTTQTGASGEYVRLDMSWRHVSAINLKHLQQRDRHFFCKVLVTLWDLQPARRTD